MQKVKLKMNYLGTLHVVIFLPHKCYYDDGYYSFEYQGDGV